MKILSFSYEPERLNMQTDRGQTIYKNRTLAHNLQQPAQETSPFICNKMSRKPGYVGLVGGQIAISSDNPGR